MFGNQRTDADRPTTATGARNTPFSLIGGDVTIKGDISAAVDLHVDGRIEGDVSCAVLVQGSEAVIQGNVTAKVARISGTVEGAIAADELVIERGATVVGDCSYGTLSIAPGAAVTGRMTPKAAAPALKVVAGGGD